MTKVLHAQHRTSTMIGRGCPGPGGGRVLSTVRAELRVLATTPIKRPWLSVVVKTRRLWHSDSIAYFNANGIYITYGDALLLYWPVIAYLLSVTG